MDSRQLGRDAVLAAGVLALGALQVLLQGSGWTVLGGVAWMTLPLALRRRAPLLAVTIGWGALLVYEGLGEDVTSRGYAAILGLVLTVYAVARHGRRWEPVAGLLVALGCQWAAVLVQDPTDVPSLLLTSLIAGAPWASGHVVRRSLERRDQMAAENQRLILERERHTRDAVVASRAEISREMHDVLGHSLAVMVMQLGAGDHAFDTDPARARAALRAARTTGKEALEEVRDLVAMYRDDDTALDARPTPGLADVPGLVGDLAGAGLAVRLELPADLPPLTPAVDLAAFRIVQESLTNAVRHGAGDVRVDVHAEEDDLCLAIDNAVGSSSVRGRPGYGLIGMEERARSCGGSLDVAHRDGRFRVVARLPVKEAL